MLNVIKPTRSGRDSSPRLQFFKLNYAVEVGNFPFLLADSATLIEYMHALEQALKLLALNNI